MNEGKQTNQSENGKQVHAFVAELIDDGTADAREQIVAQLVSRLLRRGAL